MKKLVIFLSVIVVHCTNSFGQGNTMYPIAPNNYVHTCTIDNENINVNYPGNLYLGSSNSNMLGAGSFNVLGNSQVVIKAKAINLKDTHLKSDNNNGTHLSARSTNIACNFSTTNGFPDVPIYEKIEYGIELPDEIQAQIDLFLNSNTSAANANHPGLNPYDPDDISIEATVTADINDAHFTVPSTIPNNPTIQTFKVYGFYYQEAAASADLTTWTVNTHTPYPFRIRIAPPYIGNYEVEFSVKYKTSAGYKTLSLSSFMCGNNSGPGSGLLTANFNAVANTSGKAIAKGYLEVGQHKRHLRHSYDNSSFFPIGMNIPKPPCSNNPCPDPQINPQGMINRRYEFSQLSANGGNYTRILSFSGTDNGVNYVENTKRRQVDPINQIGNYQANQHIMMETDLDIKAFEDYGIFATWCLQAYGFDEIPNINEYYDSWAINPYSYELNQSNILSFFEANESKRFFKNRLRYVQARWGYSAAIAIYQLNSEIDDFGRYRLGTAPNEVWVNRYRTDPTFAQKGEAWQIEMAGYIKSIYPNHLISSSYVADPTQFVTTDPYEFPIVCHDKFIHNNNCDIISWNPYAEASVSNTAEELNRGRWNAINQFAYSTYNNSIVAACNPDENRYSDKPVFFSEAGMSFVFDIDSYTDIQMHNMIWASSCSGALGAGLTWQTWEAYTSGSQIEKKFQNFNAISSFFDDIDFEAQKYEPCVNEEAELIDKGGSIKVNENMGLEIFVMANDNSSFGEKSDRGFGWVHHRRAIWDIRVEESWFPDDLSTLNVNEGHYVFPPLPNSPSLASINEQTYNYKLNGFKSGNYLIEIFDTFYGNIIYSSSSNDDIHASLTNILTIGIPNIELYKNNYTEILDYGFKFFHASVNGNDLRIAPLKDSIYNSIILPGNDGNFKKYFLVSMVPNPASENINITSAGENINYVSITDICGNLVFLKSSINTEAFDANISDLSPGAYFVNVKSFSGITKIFKLIKV